MTYESINVDAVDMDNTHSQVAKPFFPQSRRRKKEDLANAKYEEAMKKAKVII